MPHERPKRKRTDGGPAAAPKKIHVVQDVVEDGDYAVALEIALDKKMDFHEESVLVQGVSDVASSSTVQSQDTSSDNAGAESKVHLLQKPKEAVVDSDEEVFPGEVNPTPSPASNPLAPQIPIACVVIYLFENRSYFIITRVLPKVCEVHDPGYHDAWLADKKYYSNLPPLR
jgi:hypothetical protein